jgi:hypothetical protein
VGAARAADTAERGWEGGNSVSKKGRKAQAGVGAGVRRVGVWVYVESKAESWAPPEPVRAREEAIRPLGNDGLALTFFPHRPDSRTRP